MPILPSKAILADRLGDNLNRRKLQNGDTAAIVSGDIVVLDTVSNSGGHYNAKRAKATGDYVQTGSLYIAQQPASDFELVDRTNKGSKFWAVKTATIPADCSGKSRGDPVYLAAAAGDWTFLRNSDNALVRQIGYVLVADTVANGGMILFDPDTYINDMSEIGVAYDVIEARVTQASMPAAVTTGVVNLTPAVGADRPVIGAFLKYNADLDVGASGITVLNVTFACPSANLITTLDLVGETGAPKYFTAATNASDFSQMPHIEAASGNSGYVITATGNDLDQLVTLDITFYLLVAKQSL